MRGALMSEFVVQLVVRPALLEHRDCVAVFAVTISRASSFTTTTTFTLPTSIFSSSLTTTVPLRQQGAADFKILKSQCPRIFTI